MIKPVYVNGIAQLYDVYLLDGTWIGSRRVLSWAYMLLIQTWEKS